MMNSHLKGTIQLNFLNMDTGALIWSNMHHSISQRAIDADSPCLMKAQILSDYKSSGPIREHRRIIYTES